MLWGRKEGIISMAYLASPKNYALSPHNLGDFNNLYSVPQKLCFGPVRRRSKADRCVRHETDAPVGPVDNSPENYVYAPKN